jgi:hydrogenase nickel incorporation protein HypA/HybF
MHELSIAQAVVAICEQHAAGRRVERVELKVGALRQVVPDALAFSFGLVAEGTVVEGAELAIEEVPVLLACRDCADETEVDGFPLVCGSCGSAHVDVAGGEELHVESLEVVNDEPVVSGRR